MPLDELGIINAVFVQVNRQLSAISLTRGVFTLNREEQCLIIEAVGSFEDFDDNNDPYGEHDFGSVNLGSKIDCAYSR